MNTIVSFLYPFNDNWRPVAKRILTPTRYEILEMESLRLRRKDHSEQLVDLESR